MQFGVLGPLQVIAGDCDELCVISAPRLRALLAVLLWRANQAMPADELAELVWDGTPPDRAAGATRALVMRLRQQLGKRAAARVVTRAAGYAVEVSGGELDASRFETLARQTGEAARAGQWAGAARTGAEALGLWRGTPLADIPSQALRDRWAPGLEQLRMQVLEWRIEADLHEGRHVELIPELRDLAAAHLLRENLHGQLMLALCRSGRQAEALAAYRNVRDVLAEELGIEPAAALRRLHQQILAGDPGLSGPQAAAATATHAEPAAPAEPAVRRPAAATSPFAHGRGRKVVTGLLAGAAVLGLAAFLASTRTTDGARQPAAGHGSASTARTAPRRPRPGSPKDIIRAPRQPVRNTFQGEADGWIQLWGDIGLRLAARPALGGGSLLLTANGTGSSAVGTASEVTQLRTGDIVTFHVWSSGQPGSVRPFVASDSNVLAFAMAASLPSTPGWFTLTWKVPPTSSVEGIGIEVVNPGNGSLTLALGDLSWP